MPLDCVLVMDVHDGVLALYMTKYYQPINVPKSGKAMCANCSGLIRKTNNISTIPCFHDHSIQSTYIYMYFTDILGNI